MAKIDDEWDEEEDHEELTDDDLCVVLGISQEELDEQREDWEIIEFETQEELNAWLEKHDCGELVERE